MYRALYTAATGMETQQMNLENIANNLANANTAGFRRRRLQFQDLIYQNLVQPGAASTQQTTFSTGLQVGLGVRSSASEVIQQQGDFNTTGNPLDLTIQGQGFFQVQMPDGRLPIHAPAPFSWIPPGSLSLPTATNCSRQSLFPPPPRISPSALTAPSACSFPASSRLSRSAISNSPPSRIPAASAASATICISKPPRREI